MIQRPPEERENVVRFHDGPPGCTSSGRGPALGAGCCWFESGHPDEEDSGDRSSTVECSVVSRVMRVRFPSVTPCSLVAQWTEHPFPKRTIRARLPARGLRWPVKLLGRLADCRSVVGGFDSRTGRRCRRSMLATARRDRNSNRRHGPSLFFCPVRAACRTVSCRPILKGRECRSPGSRSGQAGWTPNPTVCGVRFVGGPRRKPTAEPKRRPPLRPCVESSRHRLGRSSNREDVGVASRKCGFEARSLHRNDEVHAHRALPSRSVQGDVAQRESSALAGQRLSVRSRSSPPWYNGRRGRSLPRCVLDRVRDSDGRAGRSDVEAALRGGKEGRQGSRLRDASAASRPCSGARDRQHAGLHRGHGMALGHPCGSGLPHRDARAASLIFCRCCWSERPPGTRTRRVRFSTAAPCGRGRLVRRLASNQRRCAFDSRRPLPDGTQVLCMRLQPDQRGSCAAASIAWR